MRPERPRPSVSSKPRTSSQTAPVPERAGKPLPAFPVYALWFLMTWEVDQYLSATIHGPFYRAPMLLVPVLFVALLSRGSKRALYWPLVVFVLLHLGAALFSVNAGLARDAFKYMLYVLVLFGCTVCFLDTPAKISVVLKLYLAHFIWFGIQGIPSGRVGWHPLLANEDSYGPLMVMAMGFAYFYGMATASRRWRRIAQIAFFLGMLGLVVSFARGAAIAGAATLLFILVRSPQRMKTIITLVVLVIVLVPVAAMFVSIDEYIAEIQSSSEGDDGRIAVWTLAWNVFKTSPVFGVGAFNFGPVASEITLPDEKRAKGADPAQLWNAWVHNAPMQILAEEGLIGIGVWIVMVLGFFRRNAHLRREDAKARWASWGGEVLDVRMISLGLDAAMIGWIGCSLFYNQIYLHWFWSLITLSYALALVVDRAPEGPREKAPAK